MSPEYRIMRCPKCIEERSYFGRAVWPGEGDVCCEWHKDVPLVEVKPPDPQKKALDKPPK